MVLLETNVVRLVTFILNDNGSYNSNFNWFEWFAISAGLLDLWWCDVKVLVPPWFLFPNDSLPSLNLINLSVITLDWIWTLISLPVFVVIIFTWLQLVLFPWRYILRVLFPCSRYLGSCLGFVLRPVAFCGLPKSPKTWIIVRHVLFDLLPSWSFSCICSVHYYDRL